MGILFQGEPVEIYTQPIQWLDFARYSKDLEENHQANVEFGFTGSLCYLNHHDYFDPWQLAGKQVLKTGKKPLVAVNPAYHHPYIVARSIFSVSHWLGGPIALNFIAGTSINDLAQIGMMDSKENRYKRLDEFITVLKKFLSEPNTWSFEGAFYQIENASFIGENPHYPDLFVAGHSELAEQMSSAQKCTQAQSLLSAHFELEPNLKNRALGFGIKLAEDVELAKNRLIDQLKIDKMAIALSRLKKHNTDAQWKADQYKDLESNRVSEHYFPETIQSAANVPFLAGNLASVSEYLEGFLLSGCRHFILPVIDRNGYKDIKRAFEAAGCSFL